MTEPKDKQQEESDDIILDIAEQVFGASRDDVRKRRFDPFRHGDDTLVYERHAKEEDDDD